MFNIPAGEQQACADDMNRWLAAGQLKALVGAWFLLDKTADAHRLQEDNTLRKAGTLHGKILILPAT
jgi:NADPH2:quinone reductase